MLADPNLDRRLRPRAPDAYRLTDRSMRGVARAWGGSGPPQVELLYAEEDSAILSSFARQLVFRLAIAIETGLTIRFRERPADCQRFVFQGFSARIDIGAGGGGTDMKLVSYWASGMQASAKEPGFLSLGTDDARVSGRNIKSTVLAVPNNRAWWAVPQVELGGFCCSPPAGVPTTSEVTEFGRG